MTPTEQDKMSDIDKLEKRFAEWAYRVSIGDLMPDTLVRGAVQLITADRKRVALGARLDELNNVRDMDLSLVSHHRVIDRIAELKAEQEEV